ncbi:probable trehalose-phosphate phosphatase E isoform X3 [Brassica rapa]|uniref:probable trehalose-phosphate phosphatase E isoform X3 n=1 Tax=Brassica campestris TaxID=3711 RepID=UPI00142D5C17|nr:probable trehalose-phosphate phosphatase E isoform X3 [Brassica rapa]
MVRFIEENITKMLETKIISKSEVLYAGGDDGDTSPATKIFQDFQINEEDVGRGGGLIRSWVDSMRACSPTHLKPFDNQSSWIKEHPSALNMFEEILHESEGKQIVMFLDYDGTLSPIVDDPDRAFMSNKMRNTVRKLAMCFPTVIVSGRSREKVYSFVKLTELYYAGSHGMDIKGPEQNSKYKKKTQSLLCQPATEFLPVISEKWSDLAHLVRSVLKNYPKLMLTQGRKVLEIRPIIKWDKGKALEFLLESLGYENCTHVFPIYIGDDRTDEDAFKILRDKRQGLGILVSKYAKETNASYSLQEPDEVMDFLERLVEWKKLKSGE